jgi:uroporphyrinogen-III synthase
LLDAFARVRHITRGPKPVRALRELGLTSGLTATAPTSQGVLDSLAELDLTHRRIGVQLYPGDGAAALVAALEARGAQVFALTPYRYADAADDAAVINAIHKLESDQIGLVIFTASPQIERLLKVAQRNDLGANLAAGLARTPAAAIGPVVEEALRRNGVTPVLRPDSSFHLKPLIRAILAWRAA